MNMQRVCRLSFERLERRAMLSVAAFATGQQFEVPERDTDNSQSYPDVAMADDGRYVVVWQHAFSTTDQDVRYQRFDQNHEPIGNDSVISNLGDFDEMYPRVAMAPNGNFVAVWEHEGPPSEVARDIWFALFEWDGTEIKRGRVNTTESTGGIEFDVLQTRPDVSMADDGSFVVVWRHGTGNNSDIRFRSFFPTGTPHRDSDQEVLSGGSSWDIEDRPTVAMHASGDSFVAAWEEQDFLGQTDNSDPEVAWAAFQFDAIDFGFEWQGNDRFGAVGDLFHRPSIAMRDDNFILAFEGDVEDGSSRTDAYFGIYNMDATVRQAPMHFSGLEGVPGQGQIHLGSGASHATVAASSDGGFIVTWQGTYPAISPDSEDIYYRQFNADGAVITTGQNGFSTLWDRVNTMTAGPQQAPRVANSNGSAVIVFNTSTSDPTEQDVHARGYHAQDDFGNVAATATEVFDGAVINGQFNYADDRDAFLFSATEGTYYIFEAAPTDANAELTLALVGTSGDVDEDLIDFAFGTNTQPAQIAWRAPATDTYFFGVESDDPTGYQLTLEMTESVSMGDVHINEIVLPQFDTSLGTLRAITSTVILSPNISDPAVGQGGLPHGLFVNVGPFFFATTLLPGPVVPVISNHAHQYVPATDVETFIGSDLDAFLTGPQLWTAPTPVTSADANGHVHSVSAMIFQVMTTFLYDAPAAPIPGDFNASGRVEQGDLDLVLLHWGEDGSTPPAGWVNDLPTGQTDQDELDAVLLNWGNSAAPPLAVARQSNANTKTRSAAHLTLDTQTDATRTTFASLRVPRQRARAMDAEFESEIAYNRLHPLTDLQIDGSHHSRR